MEEVLGALGIFDLLSLNTYHIIEMDKWPFTQTEVWRRLVSCQGRTRMEIEDT